MSSAFSVDMMDLQVAAHGPGARVVVVTGEVDVVTAPELANCLTRQLDVAQVVVVDLDGVRFLGSAGLSVLFETNELAIQQGRELRLVCNSRTANLALKVTGLWERFTVVGSVPDAVNNSA